MGSSELSIFLDLGKRLADRGVVRVADIDVATRARVWRFDLFVAGTIIRLPEWNGYSLFLEQSLLNVVLLLPVVVVSWPRVPQVGLAREWGSHIVFPHVSATSAGQERVHRLRHLRLLFVAVRRHPGAEHGGVASSRQGTRVICAHWGLVTLDHCVSTVGHLGGEIRLVAS